MLMNNKKGFTLIELLIVIALIAAVSALMYSFFGQGLHLYTAESESADEQMNLRRALSDITNRARLAEPEQITYDAGVLSVGDYEYTLQGGSIKKDGTAIANGISSFNVSINEGILYIEIVNASGKSLSTSFSLLE